MSCEKNYNKFVNKILKTYDAILVECKSLPDLTEKNIIRVANFSGLINAQMETRKPIL